MPKGDEGKVLVIGLEANRRSWSGDGRMRKARERVGKLGVYVVVEKEEGKGEFGYPIGVRRDYQRSPCCRGFKLGA